MEFAAEVGSGSLRPQSSRLSLDHCLKKGVLTISYKEGLKIIPYYDTFTFVCYTYVMFRHNNKKEGKNAVSALCVQGTYFPSLFCKPNQKEIREIRR